MSDDVRFRSLGEKEQRSEWEGRLRELQMEIQEREQRNKEAEQKRLQDEERKRIENQKRAGNPFKCIFQIKISDFKFKFTLEQVDLGSNRINHKRIRVQRVGLGKSISFTRS